MTFWWRLRSVWGATLAGFGWRRPRRLAALVAYPREPWWRRVWHVFRPAPPPSEVRNAGPPPWVQPPEDELGVAVPLRVVLASDSRSVIGLIDSVAFSTGFEFTIAVRTRKDIRPEELGYGPPHLVGPRDSEREPQIGIQFADGRKAFTGGRPGPEFMAQWKLHAEGGAPDPADGPIISPRSGGGGGKRWDFRYWVWPLPPEGELTFICEWKALGLGPVEHDVDASAIRRAGASSKSFWSDR